jgi:hypothetical protein
MDHYHIWCNLRAGVSDTDFCRRVDRYLGRLREEGLIEGHRIARRKLGLGPADLGEFHITIEVRDLSQLDHAFRAVARRSDPIESFHHAVNSLVTDTRFALYRDFPDPGREEGQEKF